MIEGMTLTQFENLPDGEQFKIAHRATDKALAQYGYSRKQRKDLFAQMKEQAAENNEVAEFAAALRSITL